MQRYSSGQYIMCNLEQQDLSFAALEELKETMHTNLKENVDICLSNGMDIAQGILLLQGKSHYDTNGVGELSQSLQEIAIERTNKAVADIEQVNDCSEGCARRIIDNLEVAGPNNGLVEKETEKASESENKEDLCSTKPSKLTTLQAPKGQTPAPPMTSVKCMARVKHVHEETENSKHLTRVLRSKNNVNNLAPKCSNTTKASSSKFTITRPFALATDKRAEERPAVTVPNCPSDFPQDVKTLRQKFFVAKSSHSGNIKPSVSQNPKVHTYATGFNFRSDERAKKRKEFYSKLQDKFNAQEEEKTQMQARTEKENEEALKMLRRSLTFKASPMPSFYQEGPPPKVESNKVPTTQAKSPKFSTRGRRVGSESVSNGVCEVKLSQSNGLEQLMHCSIVDVLQKSKDFMTERLVGCSLSDSPSEPSSISNPLSLSSNKGPHATENEGNCEESCCESELMNNNQKPNEGTKARQLIKGAVTKASSERHERYQSKCGSNVLRNCANKGSTMSPSRSNKMKPKGQPLLYDMKEDLSPTTNKTTKKERLKALTPYFRKRESIGNARNSITTIIAPEIAIDLDADIIVGTS